MKSYLRQNNNNEIQPIPWISKKSEFIQTESSCQYFYQGFKSVNASESVPGDQSIQEKQEHPQLMEEDMSCTQAYSLSGF